MNRAERRKKERQKEKQKLFTEGEVKELCTNSYRFGLDIAVKAASQVLGLGKVRIKRIVDKLEEIELKELNELVDEARKISKEE